MKSWIATIKNKGLEFSPTTRAMFLDYLSDHEGERVEVVARKVRKTVSKELRGFYWGAWLPFIRNLDPVMQVYSVDQLHLLLKSEFNGVDWFSPISNKTTRIVRSVMDGNAKTSDAFLYMERIRRWVAENYGEEMPDAEDFNRRRDMHFEENPVKVDYPTNSGEEPKF